MTRTVYLTLVRHAPYTRIAENGGSFLTESEFEGAKRKGLILKNKFPGSEIELLTSPYPRTMQTAYAMSDHLSTNSTHVRESAKFDELDEARNQNDIHSQVVKKLAKRGGRIEPFISIPFTRTEATRGAGIKLIKTALDRHISEDAHKPLHVVAVTHAEVINPLLAQLTSLVPEIGYDLSRGCKWPIKGKQIVRGKRYFAGIGIKSEIKDHLMYEKQNPGHFFDYLEHMTFRINKKGVTLFFRGQQFKLPDTLSEKLTELKLH